MLASVSTEQVGVSLRASEDQAGTATNWRRKPPNVAALAWLNVQPTRAHSSRSGPSSCSRVSQKRGTPWVMSVERQTERDRQREKRNETDKTDTKKKKLPIL